MLYNSPGFILLPTCCCSWPVVVVLVVIVVLIVAVGKQRNYNLAVGFFWPWLSAKHTFEFGATSTHSGGASQQNCAAQFLQIENLRYAKSSICLIKLNFSKAEREREGESMKLRKLLRTSERKLQKIHLVDFNWISQWKANFGQKRFD